MLHGVHTGADLAGLPRNDATRTDECASSDKAVNKAPGVAEFPATALRTSLFLSRARRSSAVADVEGFSATAWRISTSSSAAKRSSSAVEVATFCATHRRTSLSCVPRQAF